MLKNATNLYRSGDPSMDIERMNILLAVCVCVRVLSFWCRYSYFTAAAFNAIPFIMWIIGVTCDAYGYCHTKNVDGVDVGFLALKLSCDVRLFVISIYIRSMHIALHGQYGQHANCRLCIAYQKLNTQFCLHKCREIKGQRKLQHSQDRMHKNETITTTACCVRLLVQLCCHRRSIDCIIVFMVQELRLVVQLPRRHA